MNENTGRSVMPPAGLGSHVESHVIRDSVSGKQGPATFNVDDLPDRLRSKIVVRDDGCWLWTAGLSSGGYGRIAGYASALVHRTTYELLVGEIPVGLHIDHLCRVRHCVNPAHLEPVTPGENVLRGFGACAQHARKTHCKHGHEFTKDNIYAPPKRPLGRYCKQCKATADAARDRRQTA